MGLASLAAGAAAIAAVLFAVGTRSPSSAQSPATLSYDASSACITHVRYTNDVLPRGVGEFGTNGLNRAYWGGVHTRTAPINGNPGGSWKGFQTSWGRHQYDTYFGDASDGLGLDPFTVMPDTAAPGAPTALRIAAMPAPARATLALMANDQWVVTRAGDSFQVPADGGSLVVNVANPNGAQNKWRVGMGYAGAAITFVGTLTSGGAASGGNGTGGSNPWTISNIHVYAGSPGTTVVPGRNDEGGLRAYNFPDYYSGALDTNVDQQYGLFAARLRMPPYLPALSPAFWTLATGGVPRINGEPNRDELDIAEMFANTYGNSLNANQILWKQKTTQGKGVYPFPSGNPQADYHDYAVLVTPHGTSFYLDGKPIPGDTNLPDGTQGSADKEVMLMFQVGAPGSWLDAGSKAMTGNPWPQYFWAQWIRIYRPTGASC